MKGEAKMTINLSNVSIKRNGAWILKDIKWKVREGEHWVLFGLNGAGKSALLHLLNGDYFATKGIVKIFDKEFGKVDIGEQVRKKIGLVSSSLQEKFYGSDNAFEIVLSGAFTSIGLYEKPTDETRQKAISLLKSMNCIDFADREYDTLSQGERQRVLIARALMNNPKILIFDEPTNGLDFIAREELLDTIEKIASLEGGPNLLYVTHHVEEILPVFKNTLLLKKGEVYASGLTEEMMSETVLSKFLEMEVEVVWSNGRPLLSKKKKILNK